MASYNFELISRQLEHLDHFMQAATKTNPDVSRLYEHEALGHSINIFQNVFLGYLIDKALEQKDPHRFLKNSSKQFEKDFAQLIEKYSNVKILADKK